MLCFVLGLLVVALPGRCPVYIMVTGAPDEVEFQDIYSHKMFLGTFHDTVTGH